MRLVSKQHRRIAACVAGISLCAVGCADNGVTTPQITVESAPQNSDTRFEPPCVNLDSTRREIPADDSALGTMGPLGDEPVVQFVLPRVADPALYSDRIRPKVVRIPGGMLVSLTQFDDAGSSFGVLLAIDASGDTRWRRCLDSAPDVVATSSDQGSDELLLGWLQVLPDGSTSRTLEVWSLSQGSLSRTWDELLAANDITGDAVGYRRLHRIQSSNLLVLGPNEERTIESSDSMLILDLATWTMRLIPYPPDSIGTPFDLIDLAVADNGSLIELEYGTGVPGGRVVAIESDGTWSTSATDIDSAVGIRVDFAIGETESWLMGFDSQGNELWRRDDLADIRAEGFRTGIDGGIALVSACAPPTSADEWCPEPKLLGIDVDTGVTLWQRDGHWAVSVVGDGKAMISGPYSETANGSPAPPWRMIDLATGEPMTSTAWGDPWRFDVGCCDSPEEAWVDGGVVFTVDADSIEMWYPKTVSTPRQQVTLDGHEK